MSCIFCALSLCVLLRVVPVDTTKNPHCTGLAGGSCKVYSRFFAIDGTSELASMRQRIASAIGALTRSRTFATRGRGFQARRRLAPKRLRRFCNGRVTGDWARR